MHLGERLQRERRNRHLSQATLAEALGVSVHSISRWERGEAVPQAYYRLLLSQFFAISPNEWFEDLDPQEQPPLPSSPLWHVPSPRNPYFTGREEALQQAHTMLHSTLAAAPPLALTGLTGIGKTQVALEYTYRYAHEYETIFWVKAETYVTLIFDLVTLAGILQLPHAQDQNDLRIVESVKHWLRVHRHWLLVLDNVEDLTMVRQLDIPGANGHLLLTTCSQFTGTLAHSIDLQALPEDEGCLFLLRRARILAMDQRLEDVPEEVLQKGKQLCHELENFPLALDQAGAYIEESRCSLQSIYGGMNITICNCLLGEVSWGENIHCRRQRRSCQPIHR
ncbi:MAG: helix-turn-helix domain-containing protein [Ktedonobacteraceae bacterium]